MKNNINKKQIKSNKTEWKNINTISHLVILAMYVLHVVHNQAHNYHIILLNVLHCIIHT